MSEDAGISVRKGKFEGWEALWIEHGPLVLVLVPQVGGRIMGTFWRGHELSFVNPSLRGRVDDVASFPDVRAAKRRLGFVLWGGDKTWLAPQARWTEAVPFLDLDSGAYAAEIVPERGRVTMTSPVCRETGIRITRTLESDARPGFWRMTHTLRNAASAPVTWAAWNVAMVRRPARVFLRVRPGSAYPDGVKAYPEEGESVAARASVVAIADGIAAVEPRTGCSGCRSTAAG